MAQYGKFVLELAGREIEPIRHLRPCSPAPLPDEFVDLLLQIGQPVRPLQAVAVPEYLLGPLRPGVADANPVPRIDIALLAEGSAPCGEYLIFGDLPTAALTSYAFRHWLSTHHSVRSFLFISFFEGLIFYTLQFHVLS